MTHHPQPPIPTSAGDVIPQGFRKQKRGLNKSKRIWVEEITTEDANGFVLRYEA